MYSSLPSLTSTEIGGIITTPQASLVFSTPASGTQIISPANANTPIGVWGVSLFLNLGGAFTNGIISLAVSAIPVATFVITQTYTGSFVVVSGYAIIRLSAASPVTLQYLSNLPSTLTKVSPTFDPVSYFTFTRLA
jgi:hypothetical protein